MPYIQNDGTREGLLDGVFLPEQAGELNYFITEKCIEYIGRKGVRYHVLNEVIGVLECVKLEMYRRLASPYEDEKIAENGDVYPPMQELKNVARS